MLQNKENNTVDRLRKLVFFYKIIAFTLALFIILGVMLNLRSWLSEYTNDLGLEFFNSRPPYRKEIIDIIKPLRYSYMSMLMRTDIRMYVDFDDKKWHIYNLHRFDGQGNIMLEEGRCGICHELAAYTYMKIMPILKDEYKVSFLRVSESSFFPSTSWSHIVLCISKDTNLLPGPLTNTYLLDPSLHAYDDFNKFDNYFFHERLDMISLVSDRTRDEVWPIPGGIPIFIHNNYLLKLRIDESYGMLNKDNFTFALIATRRNKYAGRIILAFRRKDGKDILIENSMLGEKILGKKDYGNFKKRLEEFHGQIVESQEKHM